ncbi:hypothetical protein [Pseudacidovorax sp. RU35E]|uniref:DUF6950 family protein n=1 Tax=Pseudacidovorax sp. RU35E TaxID=1907403 RepID=UPI0009543449|nr:hypothetical protein [Pseudacidovorax sp. RU35E]SIR06810.1 hypothetical protein SAMN05880557_107302 [Pseudacidovorax sp. RU35E]
MDELDAFIHLRAGRAFAWWDADCTILAAEWVLQRTGADPLAPLRAEGGMLAGRRLLPALRKVRARGGFAVVASELLGPAMPGLMAQRGDVVLVRSGQRAGRVRGLAFGVCTGANIAAPGAHGIAFLPVTGAEAAWRV